MPEVLKVYVLLDCKLSFRCFDCVAVLSVNCGCNITPARGTKNFEAYFVRSGNRHKFTSMFKCASLVHPCTSVACCQTKFPVPLTALIRHLYFDEPYSDSDKHWKDCFNPLKKNTHFRTVVFRSERKSPANQRNMIRVKALSFSQLPVKISRE